MRKHYEQMRWRVAYLLDKLPGQCWTELVCWALSSGREDDGRSRLPWRPIDDACRRDAARCGSCYCGKLRADKPAEVNWRA